MKKIPATVITGFLGAGKTTVIRHMLENSGEKRIALVINEFGDLGIDRALVMGCDIEGCEEENVVELSNGCICCTVADDFLPTMKALLDRPNPPDHIVIETSGLALPKPLVKAFNWPEIRSRMTVDGVVTVVDAPAVAAGQFAHDPDAIKKIREADERLDHHSPLEEVFEDQLRCADLILLNKSDLLNAESLNDVRLFVRKEIADQVKIVDSIQGIVDTKVLLGIGADVEESISNRFSHHDLEDNHNHDNFESFVVKLGEITHLEDFESRVKAAAAKHSILRIKGFIDVPGKDMRHVIQAVGNRIQRYYDRAWAEDEIRCTEMVIIGETGLDRVAIEGTLSGH